MTEDDVPYSSLAQALRTWLRASIDAWTKMGAYREICSDFYRKVDQDTFERVCRDRKIYDFQLDGVAYRLPQFDGVVEALAQEPELRSLIGKWVGSADHLFPIVPERIAGAVKPLDVDYDHPRDIRSFDDIRIDQLLRRLHAVVNSSTFDIVYVTPIWHLELDAPTELESNVVIDVMTDEEFTRAAQMNVIAGDASLGRTFKRDRYHRLALRQVVTVPRLVPSEALKPDDVLARIHPGQFELNGFGTIERFFNVLPLVSTGDVEVGATMTWSKIGDPWGLQSALYARGARPGLNAFPRNAVLSNATLDRNTQAELVRYWMLLQRALPSEALKLAMSRLQDAASRDRVADRLIDLIIAAEALFIPSGDRSELTFRTSFHAALFLETDLAARRRVFKTLSAGYGMRSAIAHGRTPDTANVLGERLSLEQLTPRVEEIVRRALQRMLEQSSTPDWDALAVGT
jgi:hypothetical protein